MVETKLKITDRAAEPTLRPNQASASLLCFLPPTHSHPLTLAHSHTCTFEKWRKIKLMQPVWSPTHSHPLTLAHSHLHIWRRKNATSVITNPLALAHSHIYTLAHLKKKMQPVWSTTPTSTHTCTLTSPAHISAHLKVEGMSPVPHPDSPDITFLLVQGN